MAFVLAFIILYKLLSLSNVVSGGFFIEKMLSGGEFLFEDLTDIRTVEEF